VPRFKENFLCPAVFIYLCYTHRHCSGSDHIALKHITNREQGIGKDAQGNCVIYGTILECGQRYWKKLKKKRTSVRTVDVLTRIHNGHLLNTSKKLSHLNQLTQRNTKVQAIKISLRSMSLIKPHTSCSTNSVTKPKHDG
jgi:hypothetical protein